jgi:sugar lactone lactonase YvrE
MPVSAPEVLLDDLTFPEGPRWHEGRLVFSDFYRHEVVSVGLDGKRETVVSLDDRPSGLGWQPDGRMLIVAMTTQQVLRVEGGRAVPFADLSPVASGLCNDMVVDAEGGAYVGCFGFDQEAGESPKLGNMMRVSSEGEVSVASPDMSFGNGMTISPDGRTLLAAETYERRITAFDRAEDGTLSGRRVFADLGAHFPDGITRDAEGDLWVASPVQHAVLHVRDGGEILEEIALPEEQPLACMLGGDDGRTLFICTTRVMGPDAKDAASGRIYVAQAPAPHAGLP